RTSLAAIFVFSQYLWWIEAGGEASQRWPGKARGAAQSGSGISLTGICDATQQRRPGELAPLIPR
ncbi:hypothetical protein, partial [Pseudofulvimonas gallinarii]